MYIINEICWHSYLFKTWRLLKEKFAYSKFRMLEIEMLKNFTLTSTLTGQNSLVLPYPNITAMSSECMSMCLSVQVDFNLWAFVQWPFEVRWLWTKGPVTCAQSYGYCIITMNMCSKVRCLVACLHLQLQGCFNCSTHVFSPHLCPWGPLMPCASPPANFCHLFGQVAYKICLVWLLGSAGI